VIPVVVPRDSSSPSDDRYLPLVALSEYSGLSVRTLRSHLVDRPHPIPHFRIGGKILVRRSHFDAWAKQFRAERDGDSVSAVVDDVVNSLLR
jgi:hypothetical protein